MPVAQKTPEKKIIWQPHPGPQTAVLVRGEKEILYGGSRGGGKTDAGIAWLMKPIQERNEAGGWKYPNYRALVLRLHAEDLGEWVDRANRIYSAFGAKKKGRPPQFVFPGGHTIITNHLQDESAYMKYQGQEFQRILIEEVTHIPDKLWYLKLLGSCRSTFPGLEPQVFLTTNPGGPGHQWVRRRFVQVDGFKDESGKWIAPDPDSTGNSAPRDEKGHAIRMEQIPPATPFWVPESKSWRIFIPASVDDNPTLIQNDPGYITFLDSLPENLKKAWRHGDWNSFSGQFFTEFRPLGPMANEPAEARHVIGTKSPVAKMENWWFRRIAADWGYAHDAAVLWGAQNPITGRFHIYREMVLNKTGSVELGVKLAEATAEELILSPEPYITLTIDPMAWGKKDETKTPAENIAIGMDRVLGKGVSVLIDPQRGHKAFSSEGDEIADPSLLNQAKTNQRQIIIRPAYNARISGWQHCREMLRWKPLFEVGTGGMTDEVLPKVVIHDCCSRLIDCLSSLIHDDKIPEDVQKQPGDDAGDAFRYLLVAHSGEVHREPLLEVMNRALMKLKDKYHGEVDPTAAYMVAQRVEADYKKKQEGVAKPFSIPRPSSRQAKFHRFVM
jgi:hypothetical protein